MFKFSFILLSLLFLITGCAPREMNYRGVPASQWSRLTAEQKQLIVDQSYEEEINNNGN